MKNVILTFVMVLICTVCVSQEMRTIDNYSGYVPNSLSEISTSTTTFTDEFGRSFSIDTLKLKDFNFITTSVILKNNNDEIGGFGVTYQKGVYKVVYAFEVYTIGISNNKKYRIGASIEAIATIKTNRKKLDLSNLFNLAIVAERNKLSGSLSLSAKGFTSDNIYNMFNINGNIDQTNVQNILKNVGIMIAKFTDKTISIKPIILGMEKEKSN